MAYHALPTMEVPVAPSIPQGWSLSQDGIPLTPEGIPCPAGAVWPEGVTPPAGYGTSSDLPLLSIGAGALLGYAIGDKKTSWAALGAGLGFWFHPLG